MSERKKKRRCGRPSTVDRSHLKRADPVWERWPAEPQKAFEGFRIYRDLGGDRTLRAAAGQLGRSKELFGQWCARWCWVERVTAYDDHLERKRLEARERVAIEDAALWERRRIADGEEAYRVASKMLEKCMAMLEQPLTRKRTGPDGTIILEPAKWSMATAAVLAQAAMKLKTQAHEAMNPDDDFDPETATPEECAEYVRRVLNRKKAVARLLDESPDT